MDNIPLNSVSTAYRVTRLLSALALMTVASGAMFSSIIILEPMTTEFGIGRGAGALPYTLFMVGFALGSIVLGRVTDRIGVMGPALFGALSLPAGLLITAQLHSLLPICVTLAVLCGLLGTAFSFGPLVADVSHWFTARRGLAVGIVISGSYLGGAFWPTVLQHWVDTEGWRAALTNQAIICAAIMLPLSLVFYRRAPIDEVSAAARLALNQPLGMSRGLLQGCLCVAGTGCCVAMAMPQLHIVPYVVDMGLAAMRGAEMLSLMLGFGIVSRVVSGWLSDRIGGLKTLLVGSLMQAACLVGFMLADTLTALYLMSAAFGLAQGGIVPSYTIIIRRFFPAGEAGWRIGLTLFFTMTGMALGGWIAGALYDLTGSYTLSYLNAIAFNVLNFTIASNLLVRNRSWGQPQPVPA